MEIKDLLVMVSNQKWTFAKTYAKTAPHEYIMRWYNEGLFNAIAEEIKTKGYEKPFWNQVFRYVNIGNYKYWIIGDTCNREPLK